MAYETGSASDYKDLLAKVNTFAIAHGWTNRRNITGGGEHELWLDGPGDGTQHIILGFLTRTYPVADAYNWEMSAAVAFNDALTFANQPGGVLAQHPRGPQVTLWNDTMTYWLVVTDRSIRGIAKVSNVYVPFGGGLLDTYASPGQYPLPLWVGGSSSWNDDTIADTSALHRWSYAGRELSAFWNGYAVTNADDATFGKQTQLRLRLADGTWRGFFAVDNSTNEVSVNNGAANPQNSGDWIGANRYPSIWPSTHRTGLFTARPNLDDTQPLLPIILFTSPAGPPDVPELLGEIDGIYRIPGWDVAAESVITVDSDDYLVVPDISRSTLSDFAAFRLG